MLSMGGPTPRKRAKKQQGARVEQHQHAPEIVQPAQRQPSAEKIIARLNDSLNQRANELRMTQDQLTFAQALVDELMEENTGLKAALDQITAENRMLRARCGLPEAGAIELTDDEAAALPAELVTEVPEPGEVAEAVEAPTID
jgi:hypothetical protein